MKRIPILILLLAGLGYLTLHAVGIAGPSDPPGRYEKIMALVGRMLEEGHFSPQAIDDAFSQKVFHRYLKELDPEKNMLLSVDIEKLRAYEKTIDDELKGSPVVFFKKTAEIFNARMLEAATLSKNILAKPFDFTVSEQAELDADKLSFPTSTAERMQRWRLKLKFMTLERYADALELRSKNNGKEGFVYKADSTLERESREKVSKLMDRTFDRLRLKFDYDDKFNLLVNTITTTMDPHTEFMPPVDKRYFDEEMSGEFFGIGAMLQYDDGAIKITSVVTGSPAYKSGQIQSGDIILKVGQGKEEPVDLTGFMTTDAVKLIRGKKNTEVRLIIRKPSGDQKEVSMIREKIVQDEGYARSAVLKEGDAKVGYIFLPDFYANFDDPKGRRCFTDVAKELEKLKKEGVSGVILDLRNNGGGSLYDVVQMAGLFIPEGPIVQVKDRDRQASVLSDRDRSVLYDGPLVVMVNEFSASASEIFAAAMQDYGRAMVIGSTSTFGKGTVQRNIGLDPIYGFSTSSDELGSVKLTLQKFYRITGASTQLRGVAADIVIPDNYEYMKLREKDTPEALPWDQIAKTSFITWTPGFDSEEIKKMAAKRLAQDSTFILIGQTAQWLAEQNDKKYPLLLSEYQQEQDRVKASVKKLEKLQQLRTPLLVFPLTGEENKYAPDTAKQERFNSWIGNLKKDIYLDQGVKVMKDMLSIKRSVAITY
ncbi:MAG: carboxy terminal-processing peptidase [Sphingomonadales bacterium]